MANLLLRWKINGYEKKLKNVVRSSFYKEEAVSLGPIGRVTRAYNAGNWSEAIDEAYKILVRFDDYSSAEYYLGMALARVGEIGLALEHLKAAVVSHKKAMDTFDDHYVDDLIDVATRSDRLPEVKTFFEGLAERDAKGKKLLERLRFMKKL